MQRPAFTRQVSCSASATTQQLTICRPDDWHLHVRDGAGLKSVVPHTAEHFSRAVIMPNLVPPVTSSAQVYHIPQHYAYCTNHTDSRYCTTPSPSIVRHAAAPLLINSMLCLTAAYEEKAAAILSVYMQALQYKQRIQDAVPQGTSFQPLMTCYLTDATSPADIYEAKDSGIVAYKLYPAGATTNSSSGVTNFQTVIPTLKAMADVSADGHAFHTHMCFVYRLACTLGMVGH